MVIRANKHTMTQHTHNLVCLSTLTLDDAALVKITLA